MFNFIHFKMKTLITVLILTVSIGTATANDPKYVSAMQKNIGAVYQAKTIEELQQAINALERIGAAEKDKWEPFYYSAFAYIMMATKTPEPQKKDGFLDQAKTTLDKAATISPGNSEIAAMEGFIYTIKVSVDPASRGPQYSGMAMQAFGKALELNPDNPRALSLMSQMQLGTARFFNSPTDEACATARKALEKFGSFKSDNPLAPQWGKEMTEATVNQCK
jgi:tetratricopeptide (TPR) repeat protein